MTAFKEVTHVIFDLDGTLLDTEVCYEQIVKEITESYGKTYSSDTRTKVKGSTERESIRIILSETEIPITADEFRKEYKRLEYSRLSKPPMLPGVEKLIRHLYTHNVPMALATSSSGSVTNLKTQGYKSLFDLLHHKVSGGSDPEVLRSKPAPDIFLKCAERFPDKPKPEQCLVFEDSPNGVNAALAAGMQVVMLPAADTAEELRDATLVLETLLEFNPSWFGLPPWAKSCDCTNTNNSTPIST